MPEARIDTSVPRTRARQAGAGAGAVSATIVDRARARLASVEDAPVSLEVGASVNRGTREKADGLHGGAVEVKRGRTGSAASSRADAPLPG